jgi:zinc transporter ZupT
MRPEAAGRADLAAPRRTPLWLVGVAPLLLLAALVAAVMWSGPARAIRGGDVPPVEILKFQRIALDDQGIVASVLNDGPDTVTIAQVQVDDAFWQFTADPGPVLGHLGRATIRIPYPWVQGDAHVVRLVTSTGVTFDHDIAVAVPTPRPDARSFAIFTLIGLYVGVIPVAIGLLWFPMVARLERGALDFLLALTVGLLGFLLIDAAHEGLEAAEVLPASFQGVALFAFGGLGAYLALETLGAWLRGRRRRAAGGTGMVLALLIAVGIGLHNFGEGLAIGAAFALGEAALGTLLIVGFTLHNTTEGLAIVAPLSGDGPRIRQLLSLGLVGGLPTIAGAWLGGLVYSPVWAVLFLGVGAGAIAQVVVQITRQMAGQEPVARFFARAPVMSGLLAGFAVMYATGMIVG